VRIGSGVSKSLLQLLIKLELNRSRSTLYVRQLLTEAEDESLDLTEVHRYVNSPRLLDDPLNYVDVGARGGVNPMFQNLGKRIRFILFEPDPTEFLNLSTKDSDAPTIVLPYAIGAIDGKATLHLTRKRACSSLLEPGGFMSSLFSASVNGAGKEYGDVSRFHVDATAEIDCRTLKTALLDVVDDIDILKIDTQGLEYEVLNGLGDFRPFVLNVECSTTELYRNQKTLFEVGALLRQLGYFPARLMDHHFVPDRGGRLRATLPLHGDCVFVPDGSESGLEIVNRDPEKWIAAMSAHGLLGLALWQADEFGISI